MIRKTIFWAHLIAGVSAGLVILMMSATGVLLTYEHQMTERADMKLLSSETSQGKQLPLAEALEIASQELKTDLNGITVRNSSAAPYQVSYGRRNSAYVDAYTGEFLGTGAEGIRSFMSTIRSWHRWFNVSGEGQDTARAITGASNVLFLFLLISGIYIWLPKIWVAAAFKSRILLKKRYANSKVRDYNWHHIFGFWSLIPLIAIVATATVFSYPAVRSTLNDVTSPSEPRERESASQQIVSAPENSEKMNLDALLAVVKAEAEGWKKITLRPATGTAAPVEVGIAFGYSVQPTKQATWTLNPYTGEILNKSGWEQMTFQAKTNQVVRRLHTGEFYGLIGQTIAGIVSLLACIMVWTGIALAWRRLISPLFARQSS